MAFNERILDSVNSTMDVAALNNLVMSLRPTVKRIRVQVIHKLSHSIKMLRKKKGKEEQVEINNKKADRIVEEIKILKNLNQDQISKHALGNETPFEEAAKKNDLQMKALFRMACHKLMSVKVIKWRSEHSDWKELAAFIKSKNTGRRFKNKAIAKLDPDSVNRMPVNAEKQLQRQKTIDSNSDEQSLDQKLLQLSEKPKGADSDSDADSTQWDDAGADIASLSSEEEKEGDGPTLMEEKEEEEEEEEEEVEEEEEEEEEVISAEEEEEEQEEAKDEKPSSRTIPQKNTQNIRIASKIQTQEEAKDEKGSSSIIPQKNTQNIRITSKIQKRYEQLVESDSEGNSDENVDDATSDNEGDEGGDVSSSDFSDVDDMIASNSSEEEEDVLESERVDLDLPVKAEPDKKTKKLETRACKDTVVKRLNLAECNDSTEVDVSESKPDAEKNISFMFEHEDIQRKRKSKKDNFFMSGDGDASSSEEDSDSGIEQVQKPLVQTDLDEDISFDKEKARQAVESTFVGSLCSGPAKPRANPKFQKRPHNQISRPSWQEKKDEQRMFKTMTAGQRKQFNRQAAFLKKKETGEEGQSSHGGRFAGKGGNTAFSSGSKTKDGSDKEAKNEPLHPSWEASKKRKQMESKKVVFQGKKIKFDD